MPPLLPATHFAASISEARARFKAAKVALVLLFLAVLLVGGATAALGQSALDGFDPNANGDLLGDVRVMVVQPDGKILLGGDFTTLSPNGGAAITRNHIARLNPDGTLDTAFNPDANNTVYAIAVQADGKILVAGDFSGANSIGGQTRNRIARLDATTGFADSFDPNADGVVYSIAVQKDGKILAGGVFANIGGQTRNMIARLDATTGGADSFNPNASSHVYSIVVQTDGKILAGGAFTSIGGQTRNHIARLNPDGLLDAAFDPNANDSIFSIALQADSKILAGGSFSSIGGQTRNGIARLEVTTGSADSFDAHGAEFTGVRSIAVQVDGKVLVAGSFFLGADAAHNIARLDPTTGLAEPLASPNSVVWSIVVQADGKILVGGNFTTLAHLGPTVTRNHIARLETDGRLDQTLNLSISLFGGGGGVLTTVVQPDGKILIGGSFTSVLGVERNNIARLNTDGTLDTAFNPNANSAVYAIAVQTDGKILVGGVFFNVANSIGGQPRRFIARLDATTGQADSFDPNASSVVYSIAVQTDGKILAGGAFTSIGGQLRNHIARLDATAGLADSFDPNANDDLTAIAMQADGKILAGGNFHEIGGQPRPFIARLDATTGLADSFDANATGGVTSIVVQADGKILAGGAFDRIGGQQRNYIARLDATTGLADSFNPNAASFVYSLAVQADGKILASGEFNSMGGQPRHHIARLEGTTGVADSFNPNANGAAIINSVAVAADGKILAGGDFSSIGGETRSLFARLTNDTAALQNLSVTQTSVTWTRGGSSPQFMRVAFEYSADNVSYSFLGNGTVVGSNWTLTGRSFPTRQNFYIRARGYYRSGTNNGSESITESVRNAFLAPAAPPMNLSSRMRVQTGDYVGIGGFFITGTAPKQLLLRAIGPSLTASGVPNVLADPVLELHGPAGFTTISNDNWRDTEQAAIQATGLAPTNDFESAILVTLNPGGYTAIVKGKNNTSGVALVELYDLDQAAASKLGNISTRAFVSTGADIVIAGFILGGSNGNDNVILRGIGPSLSDFGVPNTLADPTLELRDANGGLLIANNDWQDNPDQAGELIAAGLAPENQLESGIAATLPPGLYTALLAGLNNGMGVGLVEVYDLGAP
jgi:uncharacterized delta-60 repeat protein